MPIPANFQKGCSTSRGVSNVPHFGSLGGGMPQQANRIYMLTVRRESLINKKNTLESQLRGINNQLRTIESDIRATGKKYTFLNRARKRKKVTGEPDRVETKEGKKIKSVALKF